jgi:hypothetical protein
MRNSFAFDKYQKQKGSLQNMPPLGGAWFVCVDAPALLYVHIFSSPPYSQTPSIFRNEVARGEIRMANHSSTQKYAFSSILVHLAEQVCVAVTLWTCIQAVL